MNTAQTASPVEFSVRKRAERLAIVQAAAPGKSALFVRVYASVASPREASKAHRLECVDFVETEGRDCTSPACPLFGFRPFQRGQP
jgi:hypothetical protein